MNEKISRRDFLKIIGSSAISPFFRPVEYSDLNDFQIPEEEQRFLADHEINRGNQNGPARILMTYDDWQSNGEKLFQLLDIYKKHNAKAIFFILGDNLRKYAEGLYDPYGWRGLDIRRIVNEGHEVAVHGWQHDIPMTQLRSELDIQFFQCQDIFHQVFGFYPRYFRAPFGARNQYVREVAARYGLQHVMWTVESGGLDDQTLTNIQKGLNRLSDGGSGAVVLSHMMRPFDLSRANDILNFFDDRQIKPVTITNNLNPEDVYLSTTKNTTTHQDLKYFHDQPY